MAKPIILYSYYKLIKTLKEEMGFLDRATDPLIRNSVERGREPVFKQSLIYAQV